MFIVLILPTNAAANCFFNKMKLQTSSFALNMRMKNTAHVFGYSWHTGISYQTITTSGIYFSSAGIDMNPTMDCFQIGVVGFSNENSFFILEGSNKRKSQTINFVRSAHECRVVIFIWLTEYFVTNTFIFFPISKKLNAFDHDEWWWRFRFLLVFTSLFF